MSCVQPIIFHAWTILLAFCAICALPIAAGATTTLDNLQAAFNAEKNANTRYLAFAQRADSEGYCEIASLLRAAARSEEIHAANHASVIKEMGGNAQMQLETLTVRSTRENLRAAIEGESRERDAMYPASLERAKSDGNLRAIITLNYAHSAESEHTKLFRAAFSNLDRLKDSRSTVYYVCPTCGYVTQQMNFSKCTHCFTPESASEIVS